MADSPRPFYTRLPLLIALIAIFLVGVGAGVYFYLQTTGNQNVLGNKTNEQDEVKTLVEEVGKLYALPTGETPTIATVSDTTKLQNQEFFKRAQNGDKVLIYTNAKKAILYRPSTKKIVEVGPVNVDQEEQQTPQATESARPGREEAPQEVRAVLYNGTATVGLTGRLETALADYEDVVVTVTDKENAAKKTYTESVVVDLTGKNKAAADKLAQFISGKVGTLPAGEAKPADVELLLLLGSDYLK